ncbi:hypothetical protein ACR784_20255 [Sphingobacterium multivorum]
MINVILFFIVCIIATVAFFGALSMNAPWIGFAVAFGAWLWFLNKVIKP